MRIDAACIGHLWIFFDLPVHTPSSNHLKYLKYRSNPSLNKSWRRSRLLSTETALNWNQQCERPKFRHAADHIIDVPVDYTSKKDRLKNQLLKQSLSLQAEARAISRLIFSSSPAESSKSRKHPIELLLWRPTFSKQLRLTYPRPWTRSPDIVQRQNGSFFINGMTPTDDVFDRLRLRTHLASPLWAGPTPTSCSQPEGHRAARDNGPDPAYRSCRMRDVQWRNDAADRHLEDRRHPSLLCMLDLRPKGQDGVQRPVDTDGQVRQPCHRPYDRTALSAGASGHDLVLAGVTTFRESGRGECPRSRFAARGTDADEKLKRLYRLIEDGLTEMDDVPRDRLNLLKTDRDHAKAAVERAKTRSSQAVQIAPALFEQFGRSMRENITSG